MKLYELVDHYLASNAYAELAPASQGLYMQMVESVYKYGLKHMEVSSVSPRKVDAWYREWIVQYGKAKAQMMCKVLRKIWNWGYRQEVISLNPWSKMNLKDLPARTQLWTKEDFDAAYTACHYTVGYSCAAMWRLLKLLQVTGQRPSDVLSLKAIDFVAFPTSDGVRYTITVTQQKTGKRLLIEVEPFIYNTFMQDPACSNTIFSADFKRNYHTVFNKVRGQLTNPTLQLRDIRRTVATEMAEGGATDEQIRALLGHSGHSKMPETVYIVRNAKMAADGLAKRDSWIEPNDPDGRYSKMIP